MALETFRLKLLSDADMRKIHDESLTLLEDVGVAFYYEPALKMLAEAGAKVDFSTKVVKFPPSLVEKSLKEVPRKVLLAGQSEKYDLLLHNEGRVYSRTITGSEKYLDLETGESRNARLSDVQDWVKLASRLENIHYTCLPYPEDIPLNSRDVRISQVGLEHSDKHMQVQCYSGKSARYIVELVSAVQGGKARLKERPLISFTSCLISPLKFNPEDIEVLLVAAEYGIPLHVAVLPSAGGTAPVTIPGIVLSSNIEILAGITLSQIAKSGTPITYLAPKFALDMATGMALEGNVESAMAAAASMQLAREFYQVPCATFGPATDSLLPDNQSAIERTFMSLLPALSGANLLGGAGQLEGALTMSPLQLVIDDEILGMVFRICEGMEVNEETLGIEAIRRVGHTGNFLEDKHTLKNFRQTFYWPKIFTRQFKAIWEKQGAKDLNQKARERAQQLIALPKENVLDNKIITEITAIADEADKELN